jgi:nicotinic acid mononucleotide adenylyltransferase
VKLAVGTRSGYAQPELERHGDRVLSFQLDSPPISSTDVRARVAAGERVDDLVPPAVAQLIEDLRLYR